MKRILFFCLLTGILFSCKQKETVNTITGQVEGVQVGDKIVLVAQEPFTADSFLLDSVTVTAEGVFELTTYEKDRVTYLYHFKEGEQFEVEDLNPHTYPALEIFLEGYARIQITGDNKKDPRFLPTMVKQGGLYDHQDMLMIDYLHREAALLMIEYRLIQEQQTVDEDELTSLLHAYNSKITDAYYKEIDFINFNPDMAYSAYLLFYKFQPEMDIDLYEFIFQGLSPEVQATPAGMAMQFVIDHYQQFAAGSPAPDFKLTSADGEEIQLSSFKGKYVILNYQSDWNKFTKDATTPYIVDVYAQLQERDDIVVIGIEPHKPLGGVYDIEPGEVKEYLSETDAVYVHGSVWLIAEDGIQEDGRTVKEMYNLDLPPFIVFISPDGIILKRGHPFDVLLDIKSTFGIL